LQKNEPAQPQKCSALSFFYLKLFRTEKSINKSDLIESLAIKFEETDEERKELLESGNQAIFDNIESSLFWWLAQRKIFS